MRNRDEAYVDAGARINLYACLAALRNNEHVGGGMLKLRDDLDRYHEIIEATQPELIIETGTCEGGSARWFASYCEVITIDVNRVELRDPRVFVITGSSTDPAVVERVRRMIAGRRTMVVLDSDHSTQHVIDEIELYAPMVTEGCYLVVEDGIFHYAGADIREQHGLADMIGDPLQAIARTMVGRRGWRRDRAIENTYETTHHIAGWWQRAAP